MLFSSPRYFLFVATLLVLLWPRWSSDPTTSIARKKRVLAVASCLFYSAWDVRYLGLLLLVSVIDYWAADFIAAATDPTVRRRWLWFSVGSNLAILGWFKYTNFFVDTLNGVAGPWLHQRIPELDILLPAGISFYTFKSMSYTIDVYRREIPPVRSHIDYVTFITFFPELIAGPIVRASVLLPQMGRDIGVTREGWRRGASLFLLGLLKKRLIADRMAVIADDVFRDPDAWSSGALWCGLIAYTIQIYCDFSGYSDMAIGTARVLGYELPENFDMPYASRDLSEFWRRWHITLSTWLRDYLYVPLGGNRAGPLRTYVNLTATMLLGGLWHGASWNFVIWGGLHGLGLAVHRLLRDRGGGRLPSFVAVPLTLLFVMLCWVPFRAATLGDTWEYWTGLFGGGDGVRVFWPTWLAIALVLVTLAHLLGVAMKRAEPPRILAWMDLEVVREPIVGTYAVFRATTVVGAFVLVAALLGLFFFAEAGTSPFIYFQF